MNLNIVYTSEIAIDNVELNFIKSFLVNHEVKFAYFYDDGVEYIREINHFAPNAKVIFIFILPESIRPNEKLTDEVVQTVLKKYLETSKIDVHTISDGEITRVEISFPEFE